MKFRRNAFYYFAGVVFLFCILFAVCFTLQGMGAGQEYPYLLKGMWLLAALGVILLLMGIGVIWFRLGISDHLRRQPGISVVMEALLAALLIVAGVILRLRVINDLPMAPESDYKTFYEIADLLFREKLTELGIGYCDYVAMFPHVYGYPAVLSGVFSIVGVSVRNALIFNLVVQTLSCLLVWRIGRRACGRVCGLVSLAAVCFLPSSILYSNFVASEPLFTFLLLAGVWLFTLSLASRKDHEIPWRSAFLLVAMGVMLALASFVRPMAIIFLIAAVIMLLPGRQQLAPLPRNDLPLGLRVADKGWKRCLIVALSYLLVSWLFTLGTAYSVDRALAGSTASYGYNLLVGLNLESYGGWNQEDADYLYAAMEATGSAQEAHLACRDLALERLKADPRALLNLFVHKFEVLWGNDDYGASWNILFMDQQGNLTPERESLLYRLMNISDLYYLFLLIGAGLYGCLMFKQKPNVMYTCLLMFCGTVVLHLFLENQNRYHYHVMPLLCLMAGAGISGLLGLLHESVMAKLIADRKQKAEEAAAQAKIEAEQREEETRARLRAEALHAQFDMGSALREGHVRIVASQGAADANQTNAPAPPKNP